MLGLSSAVNILGLDLVPLTGILILLLAVIIPIIMYIKRRFAKGECKKNNCGTAASADA